MIEINEMTELLVRVLETNGKPLSAVYGDVFAGGASTLGRCRQLIRQSKLSRQLPPGTKHDKKSLNFHMWGALREQHDYLTGSCFSWDMEKECYIPMFEAAYSIYFDVISTWNPHHYFAAYRKYASTFGIDYIEDDVVQERVCFEVDIMSMVYHMLLHSDESIVKSVTKLIMAIENEYSCFERYQYMYQRIQGFSPVLNSSSVFNNKDVYIEQLEMKIAKQEQELHMLNATRTEVQQFTPPQQTLYIGRVDTLNTNPNIFPNQQPFYNQR